MMFNNWDSYSLHFPNNTNTDRDTDFDTRRSQTEDTGSSSQSFQWLSSQFLPDPNTLFLPPLPPSADIPSASGSMQETGPALPDSRPSLSLTELHQTLSVPSSQDAGDPFGLFLEDTWLDLPAREDQSESAYIPHSSDAAHLYLGSPQLVTPLQCQSSSLSSHTSTYSPAHTVVDTHSRESSILENNRSVLLNAFTRGTISVRNNATTRWEVQCPDCHIWVSTGMLRTVRFGHRETHFSALESHRKSKKCRMMQETVRLGRQGASMLLSEDRMRGVSAPVDSDVHHDTNEPDIDELSSDFLPRSSSAPPEAAVAVTERAERVQCTGIPIPATSSQFESAGDHLPWARVGTKPDSLPFDIEVHDRGKTVVAFAKSCTGQTISGIQPCENCSTVTQRVDDAITIARDPQKGTNRAYLSPAQLRHSLENTAAQLNQWRLRTLNLGRALGVAARKLSDCRRFAMAIAEMDVPRVQVIVQTALRKGSSLSRIVNKIEEAFEGLYQPRGQYSERDVDVATLAYRIGGRSLLYSLNHSIGLPSLRTLRKYSAFTKIMPTVGMIKCTEIVHNIREVVLKGREALHGSVPRRGVSVLIDEIALEEAAVHFRHNNCVGGLCWKHSTSVDLVLRTYQSAVNLAHALAKGTVHMGKEMSVVAVSLFGEKGCYPILAAPTCKQETAADMEMLFTSVIRSWNEVGAGTVGPLWSVATDGDSTRRAAGYNMLVKIPLSPTSSLYGTLSNMAGLNLYTGDGEITLDFDWKHIFKRFCTLLRSHTGIVLNSGIIINPTFLARYLVRLEDQTPESVQSLLYPDDPQDVPRAVRLMQAIISLRSLQLDSCDPSVVADLDAITLLGELVEAILQPFIDINMSLSEQVTCLSKFSHLSCAFFRGFRVAFMSNQLYGDSQTMVKNVMFSIAKQQQLDGSASFFVGGVGDDELEKLFGRLRMLGGHDSGMNYRQGIDRLGHAKDIDSVLLRQPDLDPGHRRLNLARTEEVDHITEDTWRGDVVAGKVDLPSAWESGAAAAAMTIQDSQMLPTSADFANIFADPTVDLLRPFGRDKYPGIEMDEDRSMVTESTTEPTLPAEEPTCAPEDEQLEAEEDETPLTLEEGLEEVPELSLPSGPGVDRNDYIEYKGRWIHKQSLCRLIINKAFVAKSHNRPERVRGFTKSNKLADTNNEDVTGPDAFIEGDMFLTLARTKQTMSLALVRSTRILEGTIARKSILIPTLSNPKANTKLEGQVMILRSTLTASGSPDDPPTTHSDTITQDSGMLASWAWNGGFIMLGAAMRGTDVVTEKACKVSIPGHLARPLNMDMVSAKGRIKDWDSQKINSVGSTWEMASVVLEALSDELWTTIIEGKIPLGTLPSIPQSTDFPYLLDDGITPGLLCEAGSRQLEAEAESTVRHCKFCAKAVPCEKDNWRNHIGAHILCKMRGITTETPVGDSMPCGFCGLSGIPECRVELSFTGTKKAIQIRSECAYACKVAYGWATKGTKAVPCRNVPIICTLCPHPSSRAGTGTLPAVWRYNMPEHIRIKHSEYASPGNPVGLSLPRPLWDDMEITQKEEAGLGIPSSSIPPPFAAILPPNESSSAASTSRGVKRTTAHPPAQEPAPKRRQVPNPTSR
ncbi:hypothetical protein B0H21DRAFT_805153 [Amylocystis lapponica]|nr:hypothetical protein B0H21DRAFT_816759 [Amylocystis lapponica]KAH9927066.1 hypothetical protein B0H21DRAFT_814544 [Amylocystis lapponica]KAH9948888.1 hypothetical protein B0H21DRAFT_805153 [Amylocystis lapponica]